MIVAVIGSGTMGSGIAQVAATSGCKVSIYDTNKEALSKSKSNLESTLSKLVEKGKIDTTEKNRIKSNITYVDALKDLSYSDLVVEAIVENIDIAFNVVKNSFTVS